MNNVCENCGLTHKGEYGSGRFCCYKCALSYSTKYDDKKAFKNASCIKCDKVYLVNKRSDLKKIICDECKKNQKRERNIKRKRKRILRDLEKPQQNEKVSRCEVCGNIFAQRKDGIAKMCSKMCRNYKLSIARSNYLLKNGTTNFNTKQEKFSYGFVENLACDSKFEQACIIYLIDVFKVESLERFSSILNFWEGENHRTFNPDFFCIKNNEVFIVECKMFWSEKNDHIYNKTIPMKKIALQKFCDSRGYNMLWLDYKYDKQLKKIYLKFLKDSKN